MDNLTHSLVGLAAAKAGLERLSPGATALCVVAANAPDADIVMALWGRWTYLHHHRGITHSIAGTLVLALALPALFYLAEWMVARWRGKPQSFRLRGLVLASLIVSATHPLMDWTNNYGVRPLLPWSAKWYYGDLVFIVDPYIWLVVGGAAFLTTANRWWKVSWWALCGLAFMSVIFFLPQQNTDAGLPWASRALLLAGILAFALAHVFKARERWGSRIALVALAMVVVYWGLLAFMHARAYKRAEQLATTYAARSGEPLKRIAAMPTLANPTYWRAVAETDRATFLFYVDLNREVDAPDVLARYAKPEGMEALAVAEASRDERAGIFLDFARFPITRTRGDCLTETLVQFADLRYTEPGSTGRGAFRLEVEVECQREAGVNKNE